MPNGVSVIGLGKLGAPMAAAMAARGVRVIGVDADAAKVEAIQQGRSPVLNLVWRMLSPQARIV